MHNMYHLDKMTRVIVNHATQQMQQESARPDGCCDMWPTRILTDFSHVYIYLVTAGSFWMCTYLSHSLIKTVRVPVTLCFTAFRFWLNINYEWERRTGAMQHLSPDSSVLWPLGGAATMRTRCWCFSLYKDNGVQHMLFQPYLDANWANIENTLFAK